MSTNDMEIEFHQLDLRYEGLRVRRPEREKRLLSSLAERGQQLAIVVVLLQDEPNRYLVIDGCKRIRALRILRRDTVHATVWNMTETEALILDRHLRTPNVHPLAPIRSMHYFLPVIEEILANPPAPEYLAYLKSKIKQYAAGNAGSLRQSLLWLSLPQHVFGVDDAASHPLILFPKYRS